MPQRLARPRKRRTRQHVIASQSVNFVERFIVDAGYTAQRVEYDYGYDLLVSTFDEEGYEEPGLIYLQLKATDAAEWSSSGHGGGLIMRKSNISYGQLDTVLSSLGFTVRVEKGKRRLYTHEPTGALMSLPDRKPTELANATYLAAVRKVLADYDIADEVEFASQLQEAS